MSATICPSCGGSLGSRYHEVAHSADVDTASIEDLEAAAAIYYRTVREFLAARQSAFTQENPS